MRNHIPCSSFRRLLLAAFFVFLIMKQGALPVLAQAPSPTPAATTTVSAENAGDKEQENIEPVDISLKDLAFLPTLLTRPPLLFTFSLTLAMFLTALLIGVMPLSLWARLIGLAPPEPEAAPLPKGGVLPPAPGTDQVAVVQQAPGAQSPPAVVERPPGARTQPPPGSPQASQPAAGAASQQPGQAPPQQGQVQQGQGQQAGQPQAQQAQQAPAQAQQGGQAPQQGAAQQGAPGQAAQGQGAQQPQAAQQTQPAQAQGGQTAQQQGTQQQQGGQAGTAPTPQAEQGGLQDLLGNQGEEEEDSLAGIDEDIQNILSGVFGEEEGIDPHLEFLASLLEEVDIEELQKTLQQVARMLQRKKRK